jgi:hypothetical protein
LKNNAIGRAYRPRASGEGFVGMTTFAEFRDAVEGNHSE